MIILLCCILQLAFVLSWIFLGKQNASPLAKWSLVVMFCSAFIAVLYRVAGDSRWVQLLSFCAALAFASVAIYQVLGFTVFPGLVKDVDIFSREHVIRSVAVLALSFVGHVLLSLAARLLRRASGLIN
jgi:hypothetical protein